jgi:hypothetical protein
MEVSTQNPMPITRSREIRLGLAIYINGVAREFYRSTDVDSRVYNWFDAQGHAVDVKDHRAVFQLKFREGRKNDFAPDESKDRHRALAKLSHMTSCFPAAFLFVLPCCCWVHSENFGCGRYFSL